MNISADGTAEELPHALGQAVVRIWGRLPHDVQQEIFEEAITARGERIRAPLAVFLHEKHPRTCASVVTRAIPEPDSLGG